LARHDAEWFFVDIDHIGLNGIDQPPNGTAIRIGVSVHIARAAHWELDDAKRLVREGFLSRFVGPGVGDDERDVHARRCQRTLASTVLRISPAVIDA
jgi:hypothetical protein